MQEDALIVGARRLFCLGLFASSLLAFRFGGFTVGDFLIVASVGLTAMGRRPDLESRGTVWKLWATALVIVGGLLAASRSIDPKSDVAVTARLIFLVTILPWQARALLDTEQRRAKAATAWVAGAALCALGTLLQAHYGSGIIPGADVTNAGRYSGFAQHVSDTGGITSAAVVFCLAGLSRRGRDARGTWLNLAFLAAASIGLLLSGSVSGLLAVACGGIYLLLRRNLSLSRVVLLGLVAWGVLALVGSIQSHTSNALTPLQRVEQVTGHYQSVTGQGGLDTSQTRVGTDKIGLDGIANSPIVGVGVDSPSGIVDPVNDLGVHNLFIGAAYQGGVLLLVGLMLPLIVAFVLSLRDKSRLGRQLNATIVAVTVFAATGPSDYNRYFWIPIALALATPLMMAQEEPEPVPVREPRGLTVVQRYRRTTSVIAPPPRRTTTAAPTAPYSV